MAKLVQIVKSGYNVVGTTEIIPATKLIPFGRLHGFPENLNYQSEVNFKGHLPDLKSKIVSSAVEHADMMGAPYFDLEFEPHMVPIIGFWSLKAKKGFYEITAQIQLYIENNPKSS